MQRTRSDAVADGQRTTTQLRRLRDQIKAVTQTDAVDISEDCETIQSTWDKLLVCFIAERVGGV